MNDQEENKPFVMTELEVTYPEGWVVSTPTDLDFIKIKRCDLDEIVMDAARYNFFVKTCSWVIQEGKTFLCLRLNGSPNCECQAARTSEVNKRIDEIEITTYFNMEKITVKRKE